MQLVESTLPATNMSSLDRCVSVLGGGLLIAAAKRDSGGRALTLLGAEMVRRGLTGHCYVYQAFGVRTRALQNGSTASVPYELGMHVRVATTIAKPRNEVFAFWRNFENLPRVMKYLVSVRESDSGLSHWIAEGPAGKQLEWFAEIIREVPDEVIAWRSLPGSRVDSAGSVRFKDAPRNRGTEIIVELQYNPPAGFVGAYVAKLFGHDPAAEVKSGLLRLKQFLETGEVAAKAGEPVKSSR